MCTNLQAVFILIQMSGMSRKQKHSPNSLSLSDKVWVGGVAGVEKRGTISAGMVVGPCREVQCRPGLQKSSLSYRAVL